MNGHVEVVRYLLAHGANANANANAYGDAPLHLAIMNDHLDVVACIVHYLAQEKKNRIRLA